MIIFAFSTDLFFREKFRALSEVSPHTIKTFRKESAMIDEINVTTPDICCFDLEGVSTETLSCMTTIRAHLQSIKIIAFYSHMRQGAQDEAMQAGASEAMPRSKLGTLTNYWGQALTL